MKYKKYIILIAIAAVIATSANTAMAAILDRSPPDRIVNGTVGETINLSIYVDVGNVSWFSDEAPVQSDVEVRNAWSNHTYTATIGIHNLTATADDGREVVSTNWTVNVTHRRGVMLSVDSDNRTTTSGTNATYTLNLTNNGSGEDVFVLSVSNADAAGTAELNVSSEVSLSAGQSRTFSLNVTNVSAGIFRVNVTATSANASAKVGYVNTTTNVTAPEPEPTPTPTAAPSSGSSGGSSGSSGGGSAPVSTEKYENLGPQENHEEYVPKGAMAFKFTKQDLVSEVGFNSKTNEGLVTAKVENLKGRPTLVKVDAPGTVHQYFNVLLGTSGYGSSTKIGDTYVIFSVPKAWLEENGVETVKLMKYKDGSWIDLATEKIGEGKYKAWTLGFSSFAIVGVRPAEATAVTAVATAAATPTATPPAETPAPVQAEAEEFPLATIMLAVVGVIVVSGLVFWRPLLTKLKIL